MFPHRGHYHGKIAKRVRSVSLTYRVLLLGLLSVASCRQATTESIRPGETSKEGQLSRAGICLANALWSLSQDPLGEHLDQYDKVWGVPSAVFSNSTDYFQMVVDDNIRIGDLVTTDVFHYIESGIMGPASSRLVRSSVIWCVVADGVADRGDRYPALMTRNVRLETLAGPAHVEEDEELGIDFGVIIDNKHEAQVIRAKTSTRAFSTELTNRVLRP